MGGQKAQFRMDEGRAKRTRTFSVKGRQESLDHFQRSGGQKVWTLSMKGRPKVQDIITEGEARRPRSLSVERRPTGGQALSVR